MRVVVISGLAGAGKTTALHAVEDLGFFCVDNLPVPLLDRFVEMCETAAEVDCVAIVTDAREREFLRGYAEAFRRLRDAGHDVRVLFLEARDEALLRRFSETRRRHPVKADDINDSISQEREFLSGLREEADTVIDTTTLTPNELKRAVQDAFGQGERQTRVSFISFGYKHGLPADADIVLDVRVLRNPYFVNELRLLDGRHDQVRAYVLETPDAQELVNRAQTLLDFLMPRYEAEGKPVVTVAVGCTGGKHRSIVIAEELARRLGERFQVRVRHRDVERET